VSAPVVIMPTLQRGNMDCGLCCLQMLSDRPYDAVRDEALRVVPRLHDRGMFASELTRVAARLGITLRKRRRWSDEEVGVLDVQLPDSRHFVVLFRGVLVNPADGLVWGDPESYLTTKQGSARALYAVEE
jgi:hypothetical protein